MVKKSIIAREVLRSDDIAFLFGMAFQPRFIPASTPLFVPNSPDVFNDIVTDEGIRAQLFAAHGRHQPELNEEVIMEYVMNQLDHFHQLNDLHSSFTHQPLCWYFPSKVIPLHPHQGAVVLEVTVALTPPTQLPSIAEQPCIHLFCDNLFIRSERSSSILDLGLVTQSSQCAQSSTQVHGHKELIHSLDDCTFVQTHLDTHDQNMPLALVRLTLVGILSWHWIPERKCIHLVLHDTWHKKRTSIHSCCISFLKWLRHFRSFESPARTSSKRDAFFSQQWIYNEIRRRSSDSDVDQWMQYMPQVDSTNELKVTLRPYQKRAVAWMLWRERSTPVHIFDDGSVQNHSLESDECTTWKNSDKLKLSCPLNGTRPNVTLCSDFAFHVPTKQVWFGVKGKIERLSIRLGRGGVLCDEMGLGKTVEVLQLIKSNKVDISQIAKLNASIPIWSHCLSSVGSFNRDLCPICLKPSSTYSGEVKCPECNRTYHRTCKPTKQLSRSLRNNPCPHCLRRVAELAHESTPTSAFPYSKATLIVVPNALFQQWESEIVKHAGDSVEMVSYRGLSQSGYISLHDLINVDVVLTTYDALRKDIANVKSLRRPRTGMRHERIVLPTPVTLLMIKWHRLAFDESQMLGASSNSQIFEMAKFIYAHHRWCVTGTPVTANDLVLSAPMFSIIGTLAPKDISSLATEEEDASNYVQAEDVDWKCILLSSAYQPGDRKWVRKSIRKFMWRTAKDDLDQTEIDIPPQIVQIIRTDFGPIERYHYDSLQQDIANAIASLHENSNNAHSLFIALRQACCHPGIGVSGRMLLHKITGHAARGDQSNGHLHGKKGALTSNVDGADDEIENLNMMDMESVLESLIEKSRIVFKDSLRQLITTMNGLAAISLIQYNVNGVLSENISHLIDAVSFYRQAWRMELEVKHISKVDPIQRIHIYFNLHYALSQVEIQKKVLKETSSLRLFPSLEKLTQTQEEIDLMKKLADVRREYLTTPQNRLRAITSDLKKCSAQLGPEPLLLETNEGGDSDGDNDKDTKVDKARNVGSKGVKVEDVVEQNNNANAAGAKEENIVVLDAVDEVDCNNLQGKGTTDMFEEGTGKSSNSKMNKRSKTNWWELAISEIISAKEQVRFMDFISSWPLTKFTEKLMIKGANFRTLAKFIEDEFRQIQAIRRTLLDTLKGLPGAREPTEAEIVQSGMCCKCRGKGTDDGIICAHCQAETIVLRMEEKLYLVDDGTLTHFGIHSHPIASNSSKDKLTGIKATRKSKRLVEKAKRSMEEARKERVDGLQLQSEFERFLILLGTMRRGHQCLSVETRVEKQAREIREERKNTMYKAWMGKLKSIKHETMLAKSVLEAQRLILSSLDEIRMASNRLFLSPSDDESMTNVSENTKQRWIKKKNLSTEQMKLYSQRQKLTMEMKQSRCKYKHLLNLKQESEKRGSIEEEGGEVEEVVGSGRSTGRKRGRDETVDSSCVICFLSFEEVLQVGILECGHIFCRGCTELLKTKYRRCGPPPGVMANTLMCPTCRQAVRTDKTIFALSTSKKKPEKRHRTNEFNERHVDVRPSTVDVDKQSRRMTAMQGEDEVQAVEQEVIWIESDEDETACTVATSEQLPQKRHRANESNEGRHVNTRSSTVSNETEKMTTVNTEDEITPVLKEPKGRDNGRISNMKPSNDLQKDDGTHDEMLENDEDDITPISNKSNDQVNGQVSTMKPSETDDMQDDTPDEARPSFMDNGIVTGSVGAKSIAIVRLLRGIWKQDAGSKVVIFSEWTEVLEVIRWALGLNDISFIDGSDVRDSGKFGNLVTSFRNESRKGIAILLPVRRAGAGLNLIEAHHIILVEPWLDVALERQAVGRVHRFGQTKTTYVHRVVVTGTVEESIVNLAESLRKEEVTNKALSDKPLQVNWREVLKDVQKRIALSPSYSFSFGNEDVTS